MSIFYIPKHDFNLEQNPKYLPHLEEAKISEQEYREGIQPFLTSLAGRYHVPNHPQIMKHLQIMGRKIFPQLRFGVNEVSLSKILNYTSKEKVNLTVPIQDKHSMKIENTEYDAKIPYHKDHLFKKGMAFQPYDKQTGSINFYKEDGIEKKVICLSKITAHKKTIFTMTHSDEALDNLFR
jgi:hypothetical protein